MRALFQIFCLLHIPGGALTSAPCFLFLIIIIKALSMFSLSEVGSTSFRQGPGHSIPQGILICTTGIINTMANFQPMGGDNFLSLAQIITLYSRFNDGTEMRRIKAVSNNRGKWQNKCASFSSSVRTGRTMMRAAAVGEFFVVASQ